MRLCYAAENLAAIYSFQLLHSSAGPVKMVFKSVDVFRLSLRVRMRLADMHPIKLLASCGLISVDNQY